MRQLFSFLLAGLVLGCSSVPRFSSPAPTALAPSQGIKPLGFLSTDNLQPFGLASPSGIAADQSGNLYIADTNHDRIVKLSPDGFLLKQQGGFGLGTGQFNRPAGLCVDRGLNLYVADSQNKRVQFLDLNLNFVSLIQPAETSDFHGLGNAADVALSLAGDMYISDTWNDCVIQTDNFFTFKNKIGGFETGAGRLQDPLGLALDSQGNLYVADSGNKRVAVFDNFGSFIKSLGQEILSRPTDVVLYGSEILVCDQELSQILAFDQNGKLLWRQGSIGSQAGQFRQPAGLALFGPKLYVAEKGNNRVQQFEIIR